MTPNSFYIVRFNDCDPFGHLNNSKYIDYMLNAREDHLREYFGIELKQYQQEGFGWVVSSHEIQYIRPASYNEKISIQSDLIAAGDSQLLVEMRMFDESMQSLKALLWTRFTCVNIKTGRKQLHTEAFMERIKDLVVDVNVEAGFKGRIGQFLNASVKM
jgi:YbgC/YbaW family acyl-CoA thioester hydrolase